MKGAWELVLAPPNLHRIERPHALKIPARRVEYSLTENVASPFQAEPRQGDADCRWNLFSVYCRPVGQVIFANWLATTSAMSGKSPIHSSRRLVPGSRLVERDISDLSSQLPNWLLE